MRLRLGFRIAACLALVCVSFAQPADAAGPGVPFVSKGSGAHAFGVFTAGPEGADWSIPSGARLHLTPNTAVRVFARSQALDLGGGGKTPTWSLSLVRGRVDIEAPTKPRNAVLVSVDRVSAVVTEGSACVLASASDVVVANRSGVVRTFIDQRWATVERGHLARVSSQHPSWQ